MEKIRIRDKHPGYATATLLLIWYLYLEDPVPPDVFLGREAPNHGSEGVRVSKLSHIVSGKKYPHENGRLFDFQHPVCNLEI